MTSVTGPMPDDVTAVPTPDGVEAWCDDCGSVAWFEHDDQDRALGRAEQAARLHAYNGHCAIWLDLQGEPTTIKTDVYAGGNLHLFEAS